MKLKKTILATMLASSFFMGTSAQADAGCDGALGNLYSAYSQYGGGVYIADLIYGSVPVNGGITSSGRMMIMMAQVHARKTCEL